MKSKHSIFYISILILQSLLIVAILVIRGINSNYIDPEYAVKTFEGTLESREYTFDNFTKCYFLNSYDPITDFSKGTEFKGAIPNLRIIDSDEYKVVIEANKDLFDAIKIDVYNEKDSIKSLTIAFSDDCYLPVHVNDLSYAYDAGLYITFDKFDVTIYGKVQSLLSDNALNLSYMAPQCEKMYISLENDKKVNANIYNIDTNEFELRCADKDKIKLAGNVKNKARIYSYGNAKIDANDLIIGTKDFNIYSGFLELSYVKCSDRYYVGALWFYGDSITIHLIIIFLLVFPYILMNRIIFYVCVRKERKRNLQSTSK